MYYIYSLTLQAAVMPISCQQVLCKIACVSLYCSGATPAYWHHPNMTVSTLHHYSPTLMSAVMCIIRHVTIQTSFCLHNKSVYVRAGLSRTEQALAAMVLLAFVMLCASLSISYPRLPLPAGDSSLTANGMTSMLGNISNMTVQIYPAALTTAKSVLIALVEEIDSMLAWTPELSLGSAVSLGIPKQVHICLSVGVGGFFAIPALTGKRANWGLLLNTASAAASASATRTKGMKELKFSRLLAMTILLGSMAMLIVLYVILLRLHGQLGMDWLLDLVFSLKVAGKMIGALDQVLEGV